MRLPDTGAPIETEVSARYRLAAQGTLFRVGDRRAVLSEKRQKLFELNESAACLASRLEKGACFAELTACLVRQGFDPAAAAAHVMQSLLLWSREGVAVAEMPPRPHQACLRQPIALGDALATLHYGSPELARLGAPVFQHLETKAAAGAGPDYQLVEADGLALVGRPGRPMQIVTPRQAVPALKGLLIEDILDSSAAPMALHCACLVRNGQALLLAGAPGAGKSTLTLALMAAGFGYGGDDVTLLGDAGRARGIPLAPTAKTGAWRLIAKINDAALNDAPIHHRLDGKRIRFVPLPRDAAHADWLPVRWVVVLQRGKGEAARLAELEPVEALAALIKEAYSKRGAAGAADFAKLVGLVSGAHCRRLHYSELGEAVRAIEALCTDG